MIARENELEVFGGLCALWAVIKKYEYGDKESWKNIDLIVNNLFPELEWMLSNVIILKN